MNKIGTLFLFQFRLYRKSILIWAFALFGFMAMYMMFFSTMQEIAQVKLKFMPEAYLQLMGISDLSGINNYNSYYAMIFHILLIVISIFAITFGMNLLLKEEKNKTIEFLYSLEVTRSQIFCSKLLLAFFALFLVCMAASFGGILLGFIVGDQSFQLDKLIPKIATGCLIPFLYLTITFSAAALSSKRSTTGLGCGFLLTTYLLGYLGNLLHTKAQWLCYFSPFEVLSPSKTLQWDGETLFICAFYLLLFVISLLIGWLRYQKRDFQL